MNLCALEKFYYDAVTEGIARCKSAIEAFNKFSSPLRLTVKEVFARHLVLEFFGEEQITVSIHLLFDRCYASLSKRTI